MDVTSFNWFPPSLRLVGLVLSPGIADTVHGCERISKAKALAIVKHLIAALPARSSSGHRCRIDAPLRSFRTQHQRGVRRYSNQIAALVATKNWDAPEVWLPTTDAWRFTGPSDPGPPRGVRVTAVMISASGFVGPGMGQGRCRAGAAAATRGGHPESSVADSRILWERQQSACAAL